MKTTNILVRNCFKKLSRLSFFIRIEGTSLQLMDKNCCAEKLIGETNSSMTHTGLMLNEDSFKIFYVSFQKRNENR